MGVFYFPKDSSICFTRGAVGTNDLVSPFSRDISNTPICTFKLLSIRPTSFFWAIVETRMYFSGTFLSSVFIFNKGMTSSLQKKAAFVIRERKVLIRQFVIIAFCRNQYEIAASPYFPPSNLY